MSRIPRLAMLLASALVSLVFLAGSVGTPRVGPDVRSAGKSTPVALYHARPDGRTVTDARCQSGKCHPPSPHERGGAEAAFRNFHGGFAECLVCHGNGTEVGWAATKDPSGRLVLASDTPVSQGNPHERLVPPTRCRGCHSESGMNMLVARGIKEFPKGFENPMALRMIEERRNRWLPPGLR